MIDFGALMKEVERDDVVRHHVEAYMGFEIPEDRLFFCDGFTPPGLVTICHGSGEGPFCVIVGRGWVLENVP